MITEDLIDDARDRLVAANDRFGYQGDEEDQAWDMLEYAWGREPEWEEEVPAVVERRFQRLVERRITGEPLAYIIGWVDFDDFRLDIGPGMFVPRPTSEFLARQAIRRLHGRDRPVQVDLATGIGPVAIQSARAVPYATVWGLDISRKSLDQARANARKLGLRNIRFRRSDLFSGLSGKLRGSLDVITMHPPYVPRHEISDLPREIREFEPEHTLSDGSRDGFGLLSRAIEEGLEWIRPRGWMLVEIAPSESREVCRLMRHAGYRHVRSTHGSMRHTRVVVARV